MCMLVLPMPAYTYTTNNPTSIRVFACKRKPMKHRNSSCLCLEKNQEITHLLYGLFAHMVNTLQSRFLFKLEFYLYRKNQEKTRLLYG